MATQAALRHDEHVAAAAIWDQRAKAEKDAGMKAQYRDLADRHKQGKQLFENLARYAPIQSSQELAAAIPKVEAILRDLQEVEL